MDAPLRATQRIRRRLLLSTCLQPVYLPARALLATLAPSWRGPRARALGYGLPRMVWRRPVAYSSAP